MKILAISNLKGGVGKSTIAQNIAAQFAQNGVKVCIADTDTEQKTSVKWASLRDSSLVSIPVFSIAPEKVSQEILGLKQKFLVRPSLGQSKKRGCSQAKNRAKMPI